MGMGKSSPLPGLAFLVIFFILGLAILGLFGIIFFPRLKQIQVWIFCLDWIGIQSCSQTYVTQVKLQEHRQSREGLANSSIPWKWNLYNLRLFFVFWNRHGSGRKSLEDSH